MAFPLEESLSLIKAEYQKSKAPIITFMAAKGSAPFTILIGTILSARTKDSTTEKVMARLFARADTPIKMVKLSVSDLEKLIYGVGFYKNKAKQLKECAQILIDKFNGVVPSTLEELVTLPGVGRKTANLVLSEAFKIPAICVDTHVHRISNIWGIVQTKNPEKTELALIKILPKKYWSEFSQILVSYGQTVCVPVSPWCSKCVLNDICPKIGVKRNR